MGDCARPTELRSGQSILLQGKVIRHMVQHYNVLKWFNRMQKISKKDVVVVRGTLVTVGVM